jgi:hypothetical protein
VAYLRISALRRADSSKRKHRTPRVDRDSSKQPSDGYDRPKRPEDREEYPGFQPESESIKEPDSESTPFLKTGAFNRRESVGRPWNGGQLSFDRDSTREDALPGQSAASLRSSGGRVSVSYRPRRVRAR